MKKFNDASMHKLIGKTLRTGVVLSVVIMLTGGLSYLSGHAYSHMDFDSFKASQLSLTAIFKGTVAFESKAIIYLGIMILIATPIMRVALSALSFVLEGDKLYTAMTLLVLIIILLSIISGHTA